MIIVLERAFAHAAARYWRRLLPNRRRRRLSRPLARRAASDPENLGLIRIEYGFWVTVFGLMVVLVGIVIALVGGLVAQRRAASTGPPP